MRRGRAVAALCMLGAVAGQQAGTEVKEERPSITVYSCSGTDMCRPERGGLTLDSRLRSVRTVGGDVADGCMSEGEWDKEVCPDAKTCAETCAVQGVDAHSYKNKHGISRVDNGFRLQYTAGGSGSRVHLTDALTSYKIFNLKNREISFDVDVSKTRCGVTSGVTLTPMDSEGDKGIGENMAGAAYGLGACDASCARSMKFVRGQANLDDWDAATGMGSHGLCCPEMRLWEGNIKTMSMSLHACASAGPEKCEGSDCSKRCDIKGCSFNPGELGNAGFFGPGAKIDSLEPVTVVTQFITADGTDTGTLSEIRRYYVQNGKTIPNAHAIDIQFMGENSITDDFCATQQKEAGAGYLERLSKVLDGGVALTASILAGDAPSLNCAQPAGHKNSSVAFSNFMYGEISTTCPECQGDGDEEGTKALSATVPISATVPFSPAESGPKPIVQQPVFRYIAGGAGLLALVVVLAACMSKSQSSGSKRTGPNQPTRTRVPRRF